MGTQIDPRANAGKISNEAMLGHDVPFILSVQALTRLEWMYPVRDAILI